MPTPKFRLFTYIVGFIALGLSVAWMLYSWFAMQNLNGIRTAWDQYQATQERIHDALHRTYGRLGYGGLIQNFENYMQSGSPQDTATFQEDAQNLERILNAYQQLDLTPDEQQAIATLQNTLRQYQQKFELAQSAYERQGHVDIEQIERQISIDDTPALAALTILHEAVERHNTQTQTNTERALTEGHLLISYGWIWAPILLMFLVLLELNFRRLRRINRELQQSRDALDGLLTAAPDATIAVDQDGRIVLANAEAQRLFGYGEQEFLTLSLESLLPEHFRAGHRTMRDAFLASPTPRRIGETNGLWALAKDGREMLVDIGLSTMARGGTRLAIASIRDIGARITAEKALRYSEQHFHNVFNNASDGIVIVDLEGHILDVNSRFTDRLGYTRDELIGKTPELYSAPEQARLFAQRFAVIKQQGKLLTETLHITRDGRSVPVEINAQVIPYGEGKAVLAVARDISDRKRVEQALIDAEKKYRTLFELAPEGLLIVDLETLRPIDFNRTAHEQLGYSREEFMQLQVQDYEAIEKPEETQARAEKIFRTGRDDFETLHRRKDGEIRNVFVTVQRLEVGGKTAFYTVFRDVTDLRRLSERLEMATETGHIGVWDWDISANRLSWDDNMYTLYGMTQEEFPEIYEGWSSRLHPEDKAAAEQLLQQVLQGGTDYDTEFRVVWPDGSLHHIQAAGTVIRNSAGEPLRMIGTNWDITDLKQIQQDLERAKQAAEQASLAKSTFLANMSHEIRTPMNAIIGLTQLALGTKLDSRQLDYLTKIQHASRSLLGILNDILDYSKIEAGRMALEQAEFRIDEVLEQIATLFAASVEQKGLDLYYRIDPQVPQVLTGDALRINQILSNLIGNAVKFTEQGEIALRAEVATEQEQHIRLKFSVVDTGVGISPEQKRKLFQAFSQAESSTSRRFGGTGLGLAISQNLVNMMGGEIAIESALGKGSTFSFQCDFGISGPDVARHYYPVRNLQVLVVDDQFTSRQLLREMMEAWHFTVDEAQTAAQALEMLGAASRQRRLYDLILLDWKMPAMSGLELARRIRRLAEQGEISHMPTLIMVSAFRQEEIRRQAEPGDFDAFVAKPVTPSSLYDAINDLYKGTRPRMGFTGTHEDYRSLAAPIRGARILLAEDNLINQQVARELLQQAGLKVCIATNGREAVGQAENSDFDAILMDQQMPEMDGLHAAAIIRRSQPNLPIIAMTAAAMAQDRNRSLEAGMNDHISKPIEPAQLIRTLCKWIPARHPETLAQREVEITEPGGTTLPPIAGADVERGIINVGGEEDLYRVLLDMFQRRYADAYEQLQTALLTGDHEAIRQLAHAIRGSTGTLAADRLCHISTLIEKRCSEGEAIDDAQRDEFHGALIEFLEGIRAIPPDADKAGPTAAADTALALEILSDLDGLFARNELIDRKMFDSLEQAAGSLGPRRLIEKLRQAADGFDYAQARTLIEEIRTVLKVGRP